MYKLKTRKSAKKRFARTTNGYFIRRQACKSHLLEKKSSRRKRNLSKYVKASSTELNTLHKMLPYF
nr:ribosomal protein L35 [Cryptomonas borealis]